MIVRFVKVYHCIACAEGSTMVTVNCNLDFQFSELLN